EKRAAKKTRRNNVLQVDLRGADTRCVGRPKTSRRAPIASFSSSERPFVQDETSTLFTTIVINRRQTPAAAHE
ncbi:MAG TPA: hypothetical protein VG865_08250, partial [Casimicrobiaceae bacterium]|nr:hypothetical protein [Casimicrobiaceae bacterium]